MPDEGIDTKPGLTPAEAAVSYMLQRIRADADLRYHMLGTEAFERLCTAEAARVGRPLGDIKVECSKPYPHRAQDRARLPAYVKLVEAIGEMKHIDPIARQRIADLIREGKP